MPIKCGNITNYQSYNLWPPVLRIGPADHSQRVQDQEALDHVTNGLGHPSLLFANAHQVLQLVSPSPQGTLPCVVGNPAHLALLFQLHPDDGCLSPEIIPQAQHTWQQQAKLSLRDEDNPPPLITDIQMVLQHNRLCPVVLFRIRRRTARLPTGHPGRYPPTWESSATRHFSSATR